MSGFTPPATSGQVPQQSARRIAGSEIAEVDHGRETTLADQQVAGVKITVDPQWRSGPRRRRKDAPPQIQHGPPVYEPVELLEMLLQSPGANRKRYTSPRVGWSIAWCGLMERVEKSAQSGGCGHRILGRSEQRTLARKPGDDGP